MLIQLLKDNLLWLIIWIILNCGPAWYVIYKHKNTQNDVESRFKPFVRNDYQNWSYLTILWTHFFFLPRFAAGWLLFGSVVLLAKVVFLFHEQGQPKQRWQCFITRTYARWACAAFALVCGYFPMKLQRMDVDYKKWLGPDYKLSY
jgi:hypothetical protein